MAFTDVDFGRICLWTIKNTEMGKGLVFCCVPVCCCLVYTNPSTDGLWCWRLAVYCLCPYSIASMEWLESCPGISGSVYAADVCSRCAHIDAGVGRLSSGSDSYAWFCGGAVHRPIYVLLFTDDEKGVFSVNVGKYLRISAVPDFSCSYFRNYDNSNVYLFFCWDLTCYYYYLIPALLNASAADIGFCLCAGAASQTVPCGSRAAVRSGRRMQYVG